MDTSLNPCLCKDLYGYLMELCLDSCFSYLLVRNSPTSNNEVEWFSSVFGVSLSCYMVVWFGLVVVLNGGKFCIDKMLGFRGDVVHFLKKLMFLFWP